MGKYEQKQDQYVMDYLDKLLGRPTRSENETKKRTIEVKRLATSRGAITNTVRLGNRPVLSSGSSAVLARKPLTVSKAVVKLNQLKVRPQITNLSGAAMRLPMIMVKPLPPIARNDPVRSGNMLLWPDAPQRRAYFLLAQPRLVDLELLIERDASRTITGATLTLVVSIYPDEDLQELTRHHNTWTRALSVAGFRVRGAWRFLPLALTRLDAALELASPHRHTAPRISSNAQLGTATFLAELTSSGALSWREALERDGLLPGLCRMTSVFSIQTKGRGLIAHRHVLSATLQAFAHDVGEDSIGYVDKEQSFNATLVVAGDPTIEASVVEMRTRSGTSRTQVFDSNGGTLSLQASSNDLEAERVSWTARVSFQAASWPAVRAAGELSASAGWAELMNPSSWTRQVSVTSMLVDNSGRLVSAAAESSVADDRITGSLDFVADFLGGEGGLQTTFETSSQVTANVVLPRPPGTSAGQLKLTVISMRDGLSGFVVREMTPDEQWVLVKVYPDARIEITTNMTPSSEAGTEEALLHEALSELSVNAVTTEEGPVVSGPSAFSDGSVPPKFTLLNGRHRFWSLELAADTDLFLLGHEADRDVGKYWSSLAETGRLNTGRNLQIPQSVWADLRRVRRLYYRVWTSGAVDQWIDPQVSTPDELITETPFFDIKSTHSA